MVNLDELRRASARVGANPLLVQGPGGNTSVKDGGVMWIKASGTWLAEAETRDIFVPLDHQRLVAALERDDPDCATCMAYVRTDLNALGLRPSIETSVHALMPQPVVFHVHCVETIAWAIRDGAERLLAEPLAAFNWAFVPYARPGLPLAAAIRARLRPGTDVLVLGNHGLAVAADTVGRGGGIAGSRRRCAAAAGPTAGRSRPFAPGGDLPRQRLSAGGEVETHALATDPQALGDGRRCRCSIQTTRCSSASAFRASSPAHRWWRSRAAVSPYATAPARQPSQWGAALPTSCGGSRPVPGCRASMPVRLPS